LSEYPIPESLVERPSASRRRLLVLFLGLSLLAAGIAPGGLDAGDASLRFEAAKSWLDDRDGALPPGIPGAPGKDGNTYNYYGLSQSLIFASILAPLRAVGAPRPETIAKFVYSVLFLPIVFGALGVVLVVLLKEVKASRPVLPAVLCLLLGTPLLTYARSGQEENLIALAYAIILVSIVRVWQQRSSGWVLLGGAAGFALLTRLATLPTILLAFLVLLPDLWSDLRHRRHLGSVVACGLIVLGAGVTYGWWNWHRFGSPLESGYRFGFARLGVPIFDFAGWPAHIGALLVSPRRGLFWYAPILLGLPLVATQWARQQAVLKRLGRFGVVTWCVALLFFGLSGTWDGGSGWGPRYLVAPLVFLVPLFACVPWSSRLLRALLVVSICVQAASVVLPGATEDFIGAVRQDRGERCDVWTLACSGAWLRPGLAVQALRTTLSTRDLPTLEEGQPGGAADVLPTSDFRAAHWWPVRAAYRIHVISPIIGLAISLAFILSGIWLLIRTLQAERRLALLPWTGPGPRP